MSECLNVDMSQINHMSHVSQLKCLLLILGTCCSQLKINKTENARIYLRSQTIWSIKVVYTSRRLLSLRSTLKFSSTKELLVLNGMEPPASGLLQQKRVPKLLPMFLSLQVEVLMFRILRTFPEKMSSLVTAFTHLSG